MHATNYILDLLTCRIYFPNSDFRHSLAHMNGSSPPIGQNPPLFSARQKQRILIDVSGWMDEKKGRERMAPFLPRVWLEGKPRGKYFYVVFSFVFLRIAMQIHFQDYRGCAENLCGLLIWKQIILMHNDSLFIQFS